MKRPSLTCPRSWIPRRAGAVLVVTMALIVLITALLLAFYLNSTLNKQLEVSSTSRLETDILARSSLELVVADLKREMLSGSLDVGQTGGVLSPSTNIAMSPYRVLADAAMSNSTVFDNLVKQSVPGKPGFPNAAPYGANGAVSGIPGASPVSSLLPAPNNRKISLNRWNAPSLLPGDGFTSTGQAPSWIYIGRDGVTNAATTNVVGRFAFNVYNVGGLLNINVAGSPAGLSAQQRLSLKGTPAGAVLGADLGVENLAEFIGWRNAKTAANAASYTAAILTNTSGFREPEAGDNRFYTRQDLIRYAALNPTVLSTNALSFLTTFSVERNSPSWGPMTNAPAAAYKYLTLSTNAASTNRLAYMVRLPADRTVTNYDSGGNLITYQAKAGDPLLRKRFPLNQLSWIAATNNPAGVPPAAILARFGLQWNDTVKAWDYLPKTAAGGIATLNEVAADPANREPNFFEILKAAILSGSLGKQAGDGISEVGALDANSDYQIIQIGCNIIDQYRGDDLPTRVQFDATEYGTFAGTADLPYLNKMLQLFYRPPVGEQTRLGLQDVKQGILGAWLVPEFWRPHRRSTYGPAAANQDIQVRFKKGRMTFTAYDGTLNGPWSDARDLTGSRLAFTAAGAAFRAVPDVLRAPPTSASNYGMITDGAPSGFGALWGINVGFLDHFKNDVSPTEPRGFLLPGKANTMRRAQLTPDSANQVDIAFQVKKTDGSYLDYDLIRKYRPHGSSVPFHGIQGNHDASPDGGRSSPEITNIYYAISQLGTPVHGGAPIADGKTLTWAVPMGAIGRSDPRTDRFGLSFFMAPQLGWLRADLKIGGTPNYADPLTMPRACPYETLGNRPEFGGLRAVKAGSAGQFSTAGWSNSAGSGWVYPGALTDNTANSQSGSVYYADNDGIQRRALGAYQPYLMNVTSRAPLMLNHSFFSVGDLGYAHRGEPWKNLDFFTKESADAGLLDFFTISDLGDVTEGKVDLNSAPLEVLAAYLQGATLDEGTGSVISATDALALGQAIRNEAKAAPFANKSELVTRFSDGSPLRGLLGKDKTPHESYIRGLADVVQTRTWNVMIDVIAQKGRIPSGKGLDGFMVEGERRYWLHVAIDRFTGEILDQRLEAVYE